MFAYQSNACHIYSNCFVSRYIMLIMLRSKLACVHSAMDKDLCLTKMASEYCACPQKG